MDPFTIAIGAGAGLLAYLAIVGGGVALVGEGLRNAPLAERENVKAQLENAGLGSLNNTF